MLSADEVDMAVEERARGCFFSGSPVTWNVLGFHW